MTEKKAVYRVLRATPLVACGVVPLVCAACRKAVGVENRPAWQRRQEADEHYFCKACLALSEDKVEAQLLANAAEGWDVWQEGCHEPA